MVEKAAFNRLYGETYGLLYNNDIECGDLALAFDEKAKKEPSFLALAVEFERYRQDLLTSDRECAAFLLASVLAGLA